MEHERIICVLEYLSRYSDENTYVFDVCQATLECAEGLIAGNEICIIYEGQLSDTDSVP